MIGARESRALRKLQRGQSIAASTMSSPYVFVSERGSPLSIAGYQRMVARAGEAAGFGFLIHSHMCGIAAATSLPMMATTRGPSSISSAIAQSRARCATRRWRLTGSRGSGRTDARSLSAAERPRVRPPGICSQPRRKGRLQAGTIHRYIPHPESSKETPRGSKSVTHITQDWC